MGSVLSGCGGVLVADFVKMRLGCYPPSVELEDSGDESEDPQILDDFLDDPQLEKFKAFSDTQLDDEITKYRGYLGEKDGLKLKDGGAKVAKLLEKLESVKSARTKKRSSPVVRLCH